MKHIIVHLIRGEAQNAHENITRDLTEKFATHPLHERIPPHLTLKRPFELDEQGMEALCRSLDAFAASHKPSGYSLSGFGNFGNGVIYVDAIPSQEMSRDVLDLLNSLREIKAIAFDEFDNGGDFHASVAMASLKPFDYETIWNYLQSGKRPDFKMQFDNIALLKKPADKWVVERVWEMRP
ncbi:MAG: Diverged enzyme [Candidatus Taylorbacteria bacterium]|nr:Diverged enzyme [Candidatus Taylorbacteria bacterium]